MSYKAEYFHSAQITKNPALRLGFDVLVVNELTDHLSLTSIPVELRPKLINALKLLNQVLSHNAEHEKNCSMRERYINALINKYDLSIK